MNEFALVAVPVLGRALVHFVWQGGLIGLAAALALVCMRRATPQARYALACAALLACVLAPLVDVALQVRAHVADAAVVAPRLHLTSDGPGALRTVSGAADAASGLERWLPLIVALWAAGACVFCLRMVLGVMWIEHLRRRPQPALQALWQARLDALATRFGQGRHVALRLVGGMASPVSAGWLRPVVLLPTAVALRLPADLVEALLAHELAHIRRHDYLVNLLQGVVEALLFFHPVVWWLSRQVRDEREHIADRLAAQALGSPRRLAIALAELSDLEPARAAPPRFAQAAQGGVLMSRIEQLIRPDRAAGGRLAFPLLGLAAACLAFYAHAQITSTRPARAVAPASTTAAAPTVAATSLRALPKPVATRAAVLAMPVASQAATARGDDTDTDVDVDVDVDVDHDYGPDVDVDVDVDAITDAAAEASAAALAHADARAQAVARVGHGDGNAYALVRKGQRGMSLSGSTRDIEEVNALRSKIDGDFLWFRRGGRVYTVTDPAMLQRVAGAWKDSEAVGKQMEALGREMDVHGRKMSELGTRMSALSASTRHGPTPAMLKSQERIRALAAQQGQLAARQSRLAIGLGAGDEAGRARIEADMQKLESQMDALGEQIDRESDRLSDEAERVAEQSVPVEAMGRRMEEAAKPMEALGRRMEALGDRQEQLAARADREVRAAIDDAVKRGLAQPVERR